MDFKRLAIEDLKQHNALSASPEPTDKSKAALIERAILMLPEAERVILDQFYINRRKYHTERVKQLLRLEQSHIYRLKEKALDHYCLCMFGDYSSS